MTKYRTFRTTMGHTMRVRMTDEEIAERELFHMTVIGLPILTGILYALAYFGRW